MCDRELLEKAAKAAGVHGRYFWNIDDAGVECADGSVWNPLTNDGDALRLAALLRATVRIEDCFVMVRRFLMEPTICEEVTSDHPAIARLAIVRFAAAITEQKEGGGNADQA